MQYEVARAEMQNRPPRVSLASIAYETLAMVAIAGTLSFLI